MLNRTRDSSSPGGCRCRRLLAAAALWAGVLAAPSEAKDVLLVLSDAAGPYKTAADGAERALAARGVTVRRAEVGEIDPLNPGGEETVVVAIGPVAALKLDGAMAASRPLVFCMVSDPRGLGLGAKRDVSGVATDVPVSEQFGLIRRAIPGVHSVGCLYRGSSARSVRAVELAQSGLAKDMRLEKVDIDRYPSVAAAIEAMLASGVDVVWTSPDPAVFDSATVRALLLAALRAGTPVYGFSPQFVKAGALVGTGIDPATQGAQVAAIVLEGVDGTHGPRTGGTGVRLESTRYQTAVNMIVARRLSVSFPARFVQEADQIFADE